MEPFLKLEGITKSFPGVKALDDVRLECHLGEIHTLLGENGAGKSTLMSVLAGLYKPESGRISIDGKEVRPAKPAESLSLGIGMVYQHFMLVKNHSVMENILLSLDDLPGIINRKQIARRTKEILSEFGLEIDLEEPIWKLSIGEQQWVELVKLLVRDCKVLILDEPTAVLTPQEARNLFGFLKKLKEKGKSIIFISHKMREVMELSDRVTVLKKGRTVASLEAGDFDESRLASLMIGSDDIPEWEKNPVAFDETILSVSNLCVNNDKGMADVSELSFELCKGEILGIAGVAGNGQKALAEVLTGLRDACDGVIMAGGEDVTHTRGRNSLIQMIAHIPEDRKALGIAPEMSVDENLILKSYKDAKFRSGPIQNRKAIQDNYDDLVERFAIKTGPKGSPVRLLSGGNIQKVIIARELSLNPLVLVALYPTRGLDIGSAEYVHKVIAEARDKGMSTILISEDLDELLKLSDRVAVMFRGGITGVVRPEETTREEIGLMMSGEVRNAD
ncbi:ABC transporter ATP-binding protein [Limisalsivibrio acetivorans]|uniref:ABC transporter ATP-binding protein n=1 Tax=Limisalsivibrio acetivorans TaxID=1304888 RepID=UPI0003B3B6DA|nr:ABC transporter ATP-binding protein [Limisalsivibrio acetivorans]